MNIYTKIVNSTKNKNILFKNINTFACTWLSSSKRAGCSLCRIFDKIFKLTLFCRANILNSNY